MSIDTAAALNNAQNATDSNAHPGFSERFVDLLDKAGAPKRRYSWGSKRYNTSVSTFRNWCTTDIPPKYKQLRRIVSDLLDEAGLQINVSNVTAWLLMGISDPYTVENDYLAMHKIYMMLAKVIEGRGATLCGLGSDSASNAVSRAIAKFKDKNYDIETLESNIDAIEYIEALVDGILPVGS